FRLLTRARDEIAALDWNQARVVDELLNRKFPDLGFPLENGAIEIDHDVAATRQKRDGGAAVAHDLVAGGCDQRAIRAQSEFAVARKDVRAISALHFEKSVALNRHVEFAARRLRFSAGEVDPGI